MGRAELCCPCCPSDNSSARVMASKLDLRVGLMENPCDKHWKRFGCVLTSLMLVTVIGAVLAELCG